MPATPSLQRWRSTLSCAALPVTLLLPSLAQAGSLALVHMMVKGDPQAITEPLTAHPNGNLYGVSHAGGGRRSQSKYGGGTVFEVSPNGSLRVLHSFTIDNSRKEPRALVLGEDGHLYGTTQNGGAGGQHFGSVFRQQLDGTFNTIYSFPQLTTPPYAHGVGRLSLGEDGLLYGTTTSGAGDQGTVFRIASDGSGFTVLRHFNASSEGHPTGGSLTWLDGRYYGLTSDGGSQGRGTIYRISPNGTYELLHSFAAPMRPVDRLTVGPDGQLYGVVGTDGLYHGGVYRFEPGTGVLTLVHEFTKENLDGKVPRSGLTIGADGRLYGTTTDGTRTRHGAVYALSTAGAFEVLTPIYKRQSTGFQPIGGLTLGADGELYGPMAKGGLHRGLGNWWGTVYRVVQP